jgi:hypothetical protein
MKTHRFSLIALTLFLLTTPFSLQAAAFWRCTLPGGTYLVDVSKIAAISTHEYLVDGTQRVTEMTIDTVGSTVARFYYIEPNLPTTAGTTNAVTDLIKDKVDRATALTGMEAPWQKVIKNYPLTTHAHTVEYRVESKDQITKIFSSLDEAYRKQADGQFKP